MRKHKFGVNCIIGGAQKSGTTALASFLSQHSDICVPPAKEVHFFDDHQNSTFSVDLPSTVANERYQQYYPNFAGESIVIDATPFYMYYSEAPRRVFRYNKGMKWIILIRDPALRAASHYRMERSRNIEHFPAWKAFLLESQRIKSTPTNHHWGMRHFSYLSRGFYSEQLDEISKYFPIEQVLIIPSKALWDKHDQTMMNIYAFLGLNTPHTLPVRKRVFNSTRNSRFPQWLLPILRLYFTFEYFRIWRWLRRSNLAHSNFPVSTR